MKRLLLLLFILPPLTLFSQTRQKAIVDSIKSAAAINLQRVSSSIKNFPGTKVEHINVSDSGAYVTIVVRVRVPESIIAPRLYPLPITSVKTKAIITYKLPTATIPPLPPVVIEMDTVLPLPLPAIVKLRTGDIPIIKSDLVTVPPLPIVKIEIDALPRPDIPLLAAKDLRIKMTTVTAPPPPPVMFEPESFPLPAYTLFSTQNITVMKAETVIVPPPPEVKTGIIDALAPAAFTQFAIAPPSIIKTLYTVSVPVFEEKRLPVEEMHLSDEGYSLLEKLEGFSPELYSLQDGGFTIGFGFFVPYGEAKKWDKGVTWEEAEVLIREKVPGYEDQVKQYINVPLTQTEFDALTLLAYNLGGFSKATSIVNDMNNNADFEQLQHDWMRFVHSKAPGVLKGLMNRRRDEMKVRGEANYQENRKIQIFKTRK